MAVYNDPAISIEVWLRYSGNIGQVLQQEGRIDNSGHLVTGTPEEIQAKYRLMVDRGVGNNLVALGVHPRLAANCNFWEIDGPSATVKCIWPKVREGSVGRKL